MCVPYIPSFELYQDTLPWYFHGMRMPWLKCGQSGMYYTVFNNDKMKHNGHQKNSASDWWRQWIALQVVRRSATHVGWRKNGLRTVRSIQNDCWLVVRHVWLGTIHYMKITVSLLFHTSKGSCCLWFFGCSGSCCCSLSCNCVAVDGGVTLGGVCGGVSGGVCDDGVDSAVVAAGDENK